MRIDLVRHGACLDEAFLRGQSPAELTALGKEQMKAVFASISVPERVVVSSAKRCLEPVASFYQHHESLDIQIWTDFQERCFGVWDGLSYEEVKHLDNIGLQGYLESPFTYNIKQSESLVAFEKRVLIAFERLLEQATSESIHHILVVTHGGVMRVLLKHILGLNNEALFKFEIGFAARMTLESFVLECEFIPPPSFLNSHFIKLVELIQSHPTQ
ncbi:hypothetical protein MNBD_GAMMA04-36 [hydrothermal vent metagenome]|uniref:Alpha-ribazole-5'-phosphate phosphatase n=1 Tax=hydrothermal vent metagenome TaxID=652676 RepID=A0A3B0WF86_9ZZZZ